MPVILYIVEDTKGSAIPMFSRTNSILNFENPNQKLPKFQKAKIPARAKSLSKFHWTPSFFDFGSTKILLFVLATAKNIKVVR